MSDTNPQPVSDKDDRAARLRKAYGQATTAVREENRDRFEDLYEHFAKQNGVTDYQRPKSAEDKAREQLAALLEAHPSLRSEFTPADATPQG